MHATIWRDIQRKPVLIGAISDEETQKASFRYAPSFLNSQDPTPLSYFLPLRSQPYSLQEFRPYFEGLLPEAMARRRLASTLGVAEEDWLGLLLECGLDCIGDIIVNLEAFREPPAYKPLSLDSIKAFAVKPHEVTRVQVVSRLSLAGTQDKCGLYHNQAKPLSESWAIPVGSAASNYIVKFSNDVLPKLLLVEQLSMAAACACGVSCAETSLLPGNEQALCIKRFDREEVNGSVARLHQEDFTQAFGILPGSKYAEFDSGSIASITEFLKRNSVAPAQDLANLLRLVCFNYAIGNCDNHLKNLSIFHLPKGVRLTPAYDLVSTTMFPRFSRDMGMRIGRAKSIDDVSGEDFSMMVRSMGLSPLLLAKVAGALASSLHDALAQAGEDLHDEGFCEAPYLADELQEDIAPRLAVLRAL